MVPEEFEDFQQGHVFRYKREIAGVFEFDWLRLTVDFIRSCAFTILKLYQDPHGQPESGNAVSLMV